MLCGLSLREMFPFFISCFHSVERADTVSSYDGAPAASLHSADALSSSLVTRVDTVAGTLASSTTERNLILHASAL